MRNENSVPLYFPSGDIDRRLFDEEIVNSDEEQQRPTGEHFSSPGDRATGYGFASVIAHTFDESCLELLVS